MIRLGDGFDLLDPDNVRVIREIHQDYSPRISQISP